MGRRRHAAASHAAASSGQSSKVEERERVRALGMQQQVGGREVLQRELVVAEAPLEAVLETAGARA